MEQVKTGIKGFDKLIKGGFPVGKQILLTGSPGTGKTIFCLQHLYNGADKYNEKGLYVSFEEDENSLKEQAKQFGWDFSKFEKSKTVKILGVPVSELSENTVSDIIAYVQKNNIKRLIIDSLTALAINIPSTHTKVVDITDIYVKRFIYQFISKLRDLQKVNTILIAQSTNDQISVDGVSEFICDGIIKIDYESLGGAYSRTLSVRKMRQVKNEEDIQPMEIGPKGIIIHKLD